LRADVRVRVQGHYEFVLKAGAKAKTVTNNLPLLSVLAVGILLFIGPPDFYLIYCLKATEFSIRVL